MAIKKALNSLITHINPGTLADTYHSHIIENWRLILDIEV